MLGRRASSRGDGDECAVGQSEAPVMVFSMVQSVSWVVSGAQAHATLILPLPEPALLVFTAPPVISSPGFVKLFPDPFSAATRVFNTSYSYLRGKVFLCQCRNVHCVNT